MPGCPAFRHVPPAYPTRAEALKNPALLLPMPSLAWQRALGAGTGVLVALGGLSGCARRQAARDTEAPVVGFEPASREAAAEDSCAAVAPRWHKGAPLAAPLFERGAGDATFGCVVVAPPVFLTEEEALELIRGELAKEGIDLRRRDAPDVDIQLTPVSRHAFTAEGELVDLGTDPIPVRFDLSDPDLGVLVEYVSPWDCGHLGGYSGVGSVEHVDTLAGARRLVHEAARHGDAATCYGVFYAPVYQQEEPPAVSGVEDTEGLKARQAWTAERLSIVREQLRRQVGDFVAWMREEGVIPPRKGGETMDVSGSEGLP